MHSQLLLMKHKRVSVTRQNATAISTSIHDLMCQFEKLSKLAADLWSRFLQIQRREEFLETIVDNGDVSKGFEVKSAASADISRSDVDNLFSFSCQLKFPAIVEVLTSHFAVESKAHRFILFVHHEWLTRRLVEFLENYFEDKKSFSLLKGCPDKEQAIMDFFGDLTKPFDHQNRGDTDPNDWSPRTLEETNLIRKPPQKIRVLIIPLRDKEMGTIEISPELVPSLSVFFLETDWIVNNVLRCEKAFKLRHKSCLKFSPDQQSARPASKQPTKKLSKMEKVELDPTSGPFEIVHKHLLLTAFDHMNWERLQAHKLAALALQFETSLQPKLLPGSHATIGSLASIGQECRDSDTTDHHDENRNEIDHLNSFCKSRQVKRVPTLLSSPFV
jgi:hypothetical protein